MRRPKKNRNPLVIYWAPSSTPERNYQQILLDIEPVRLLRDTNKRKNLNPHPLNQGPVTPAPAGLQFCSAFHELMENVFIVKTPFDVNVFVDALGYVNKNDDYGWWFIERQSSLQDIRSVDFDMYYLFFAEESVEVTLTSPYMHQTSQPSWGFLTPVKYDLSKWFRPFGFVFHLWPNTTQVTLKQGEPLAYLHFNTDRKIEFRQFKVTPDIYNQAQACSKHKEILPFQPMKSLYERFTKSGMRSRVLQEIKSNLIGEPQ